MTWVSVVAAAIVTVVVVLTLPSLLRRAGGRRAKSQGYLGFAVEDLHEVAVRMLAVEREYRAVRVGEISETIELSQPLLLGIRPVLDGPRTGRLSLDMVKVELTFEGALRLRGVVNVRELAAFLPALRSEVSPRLVAARATGGGTELTFEVLPEGGVAGFVDRVLHLGELTVA